jgi:hypothetical protein
MVDETSSSECANIARQVLRFALSEVLKPSPDMPYAQTREYGIDFGKRWIGALHDGFRRAYKDTDLYAIFSRARPASGLTGKWTRQEYMYDVVVAHALRMSAPVDKRAMVPVITGCLWQVESEVRRNAAYVAEDLGKLVLGFAVSKGPSGNS